MKFSVKFLKRDFSAPVEFTGLNIRADRYVNSEEGGPLRADLTAIGGREDLWELVEHLRDPVEIYDEEEDLVWWGWLNGVEIHDEGVVDAVSLDEMYNKIALAYTESIPGLSVSGDRQTTDWAEDSDSQTTYGVKELMLGRNQATQEEAENQRDYELTQRKYPQPVTTIQPGKHEPFARLTCLGWWETLRWPYYSRAAGLEQNANTSGNDTIGGPAVVVESHEDSAGTQAFGVSGILTVTVALNSNADATQNMGDVAANTKVETSFSLSTGYTINQVQIKVRRQGTLTDNIEVKIFSDSGGNPNTELATSSKAGSSLSSTLTWETFVLGTPVALSASTTYHIVIQRSDANDASNYYVLNVDESLGYSGGQLKLYNGSSWGSRTPNADLTFRLNAQVGSTPRVETSFQLGQDWTVTQLAVRIRTEGSPSDNVNLKLYTDSGGAPGTLLGTATLAASEIGTGLAWVIFPLSAAVNLAASTTYHLEVSRSSSVDASDYYVVGIDTDQGYISGIMQVYIGSWVWQEDDADLDFRILGVVTKIETSFQLTGGEAWAASSVQLSANIEGSPADNLLAKLYDDSGGAPGTLLATGTVSGSSIPDSPAWVTFTLDSEVSLSLSTTYHLEVSRSGSADETDYYTIAVDEGLSYASGTLKLYTGQAWVGRDWDGETADADLAFILGGVEETTTQIETALGSAEFITGVDIEDASGIKTNQHRDGDQRMIDVIRELLATGLTGGERLLATVTSQRRVRVYQAPTRDAYKYTLDRRGNLAGVTNAPIEAQKCPVGEWVRRLDIPGEANTTRLIDLSRFFISEGTFDAKSETYTPTARNAPRPYDLPISDAMRRFG